MVKLEYPTVSQSKHSEIAQEPYGSQIMNIGQVGGPSYSPIAYLPTQYGIAQSSEDTNLMLTQHFTAIPEKSMLPLGIPTIVPSLQTVPEILHRDAVITSTQSHIQNQLQRKHEELQQLIMKQQEELQLVSEQLHLAQRGMLPIVSSSQTETNVSNRHQTRSHQHQIEKIGNNSHRTVIRLMENTTVISSNEQTSYMEQSMNPSICRTNDMPSSSPNTVSGTPSSIEQLSQVHSSQDFHNSKTSNNFDDTNHTSLSPATSSSQLNQ